MPFSSLFLTAKTLRCRPAQAELVKVQTQGKSQLGARRRLNMVRKGAEERTKTFWFRNRWLFGPRNLQSSLNEMFSFLFSLFPFFFCRTFTMFTCWGKHQSPALREQHQFRTRSVGQAWSRSACTVRKRLYILPKQCVSISYQNNASAPKGVPCRRRALFVIMATKLSKPSRRSFPCKMLVWSSSSTWQGEVSSL